MSYLINGLVLTGGHSKRMDFPKALIEYHRQPQAICAWKLLNQVCQESFLSIRSQQWRNTPLAELPSLPDRFVDFGPLGGILTAMAHDRYKPWLVVACDLPFITLPLLQELVEMRDPQKMATCFLSHGEEKTEPLCAIYEPQAYAKLLHFLSEDIFCPRRILGQIDCKTSKLPFPEALTNINTQQELKKIEHRL